MDTSSKWLGIAIGICLMDLLAVIIHTSKVGSDWGWSFLAFGLITPITIYSTYVLEHTRRGR